MEAPHIREPLENILEVHFDDPHDCAATFLRFQEHYESPEFRGKIFTLEEYQRWYIAHSPRGQTTGAFTYEEDWTGFNIPSEILDPFYRREIRSAYMLTDLDEVREVVGSDGDELCTVAQALEKNFRCASL